MIISWLECCTGFAKSRVQTPLESWLFQAFIRNCLNCVHNCDDHSLLDFKSVVQYMKHFIYHCIKELCHETAYDRQLRVNMKRLAKLFQVSRHSKFIALNLGHPRIFLAFGGFVMWNSLPAFVGFCSVDPIITV